LSICWLKVSIYPHLVGNVIISVNTGFLCFLLWSVTCWHIFQRPCCYICF